MLGPEEEGKNKTEVAQKKLDIVRIYVKEQSCKIPRAPEIFQATGKANLSMELYVKNEHINGALYEATLHLTVTAKIGDMTAYTVEVKQSGIFKFEGFSKQERQQFLNVYCSEVLYPYLRKIVSDATRETGLAPFTLQPMGFAGIYQQKLQQEQVQQSQRESAAAAAAVSPGRS